MMRFLRKNERMSSVRQALEEGKKYILHNEDVPERTFYISKVIGYGASCIVYEGYYRGELGRHYVRIKECFSEYYAAEERDADFVVWRSEEAKEKAFEKWEKAENNHKRRHKRDAHVKRCVNTQIHS